MTSKLADRIWERTATTGTGTISLGGAQQAHQSFVDGIGDGNQSYYVIAHTTRDEWEVGVGTVTAGTPDTLSRTTIYASSNSGAAVDFSIGTKDVFCDVPSTIFDGVSIPVADTTALVHDPADATKLVRIDAGAVATATTRTITMPDADVDLANIPTNLTEQVQDIVGAMTTDGEGVAAIYDDPSGAMTLKAGAYQFITDVDAATITLDLSAGLWHDVYLEGDRTLAVSGQTKGLAFRVRLLQDATGGRTPTWWANIIWPGGSAPTYASAANHWDWFEFIPRNPGGTWWYYARVLGQDYAEDHT